MKEFRELGVYRLPDGREYVLCGGPDKNLYLLFTPQAWEGGGHSEYLIRAEGKILSKGIPTRWTVEDLADTGRTVE